MTKKSEPWYIHAILYVVIAILLVVLIKVAIIDPADHIQKEEYYKDGKFLRSKEFDKDGYLVSTSGY